jgi:hypothetical protein
MEERMGKRVGQCNANEVTNYNTAAERRELGIMASIGKLEERKVELPPTDRERQLNNLKIADLTADLATLRARVHAFNQNQETINPPTDGQLTRLRAQLDAINALTTQRRILEDVVALTTDAANTFREIQPA